MNSVHSNDKLKMNPEDITVQDPPGEPVTGTPSIDREAGEIIRLVASVRLSVRQ